MSLHPSTVKYIKDHKQKFAVIGERICIINGKKVIARKYDSISDEIKEFIKKRGELAYKPNMRQFTTFESD